MKKLFALAFCVCFLAYAASSQSVSNDVISKKIKDLGSEKIFTVTYDEGGSSKLLAVAENFSNREVADSGLMAMNFAAGFFYAGNALVKELPETLKLTFWAMSKKPRFAVDHEFTFSPRMR